MKTAIELGIAKLYHYEEFNPDHLGGTVRGQTVHLSNPARLNDPWDCRPCFNYGDLTDPANIEKIVEWARETATAGAPPEAVAEYENKLRTDPDALQSLVQGLNGVVSSYFETCRIYCLTPRNDSSLMWSHYAKHHRGICLEFDVSGNLFGKAQQVDYRDDYPKWAPHSMSDDEIRNIVLTKASDWAYEREFRLVMSPTREDFLPIPAGSLVSVIAGCEADLSSIKAIVDSSMPRVQLKRAIRTLNRYNLSVELVS